MRSVLICLIAIIAGVATGVALGYWRVGESTEPLGFQAVLNDIAPPSADSPANGIPYAPAIAPHAKLVIDNAVFKFDQMQRGSERSHTFVVSNAGNAPLEIVAGPTSCKCTSFAVPVQAIAPGSQGDIKLTWVAKIDPGEFRQTATILTNDPRASRVELSVEGAVVNAADLEPQQWYLGSMRAGETQTSSITLLAFEQDTVEVTHAKVDDASQSNWYDIKVVPLDKSALPNPKAKAGVRIDVTTKPGIPLGEINSWVRIESTLPPDDEAKVWTRRVGIFGRIRGDLSIHGARWNDETSSVVMGFVPGREGAEEKMQLSAKGEHAADITYQVEKVDPPVLEVEIGERQLIREGISRTDMIVRIPKGSPTMNHLGTAQGDAVRVHLRTNHPVTPEMTFDVRFAVQQ